MQETFEKSDILEAHSEIIREIFMQTNKQHHEWLLTSLLTGIIFIIVTLMVIANTQATQNFDHSIAQIMQHNRTPAKTQFFLFITSLGNPLQNIGFTLVLVGWLVYVKYYRLLSFAAFSILVGTLGNTAIKLLVQRPRPLHKLISIGGYSFPSGHSTSTIILLGVIMIIFASLVKSKWQRGLVNLFAISMILLIGMSRIYLNVHYPSDVLGGFLFGTTIVLLSGFLILPTKTEV
ncbi:phosphatase PAP2 family protein [Pediococcus parvulus]|jgi:undecaprenyl-diphosphatase|uniref:Phosphatase PAP2 family protein n=2 Tax=Pediococcus parvulus TaxID=54062 RepID=A0AAP5TCZ8_9LACO|nr:phosphatase PAP2 family protein [Pediococcus parvulus]HBO46686.1 PAP2 family protein [Pediococcus sp.]MCT3027989.1 phosphatase PAP2 family protein [Pediococcus parvulus]MCT3028312.1 phosphatase PAP2 family protein [Pediococcus parvulus]MCT3030305.1 phosphatase PAP2 family protein [Pediococcus parvulus]MCT3033987.1 phosphatase PAP2 family protein [Pediococcus parvulus]